MSKAKAILGPLSDGPQRFCANLHQVEIWFFAVETNSKCIYFEINFAKTAAF